MRNTNNPENQTKATDPDQSRPDADQHSGYIEEVVYMKKNLSAQIAELQETLNKMHDPKYYGHREITRGVVIDRHGDRHGGRSYKREIWRRDWLGWPGAGCEVEDLGCAAEALRLLQDELVVAEVMLTCPKDL